MLSARVRREDLELFHNKGELEEEDSQTLYNRGHNTDRGRGRGRGYNKRNFRQSNNANENSVSKKAMKKLVLSLK